MGQTRSSVGKPYGRRLEASNYVAKKCALVSVLGVISFVSSIFRASPTLDKPAAFLCFKIYGSWIYALEFQSAIFLSINETSGLVKMWRWLQHNFKLLWHQITWTLSLNKNSCVPSAKYTLLPAIKKGCGKIMFQGKPSSHTRQAFASASRCCR